MTERLFIMLYLFILLDLMVPALLIKAEIDFVINGRNAKLTGISRFVRSFLQYSRVKLSMYCVKLFKK